MGDGLKHGEGGGFRFPSSMSFIWVFTAANSPGAKSSPYCSCRGALVSNLAVQVTAALIKAPLAMPLAHVYLCRKQTGVAFPPRPSQGFRFSTTRLVPVKPGAPIQVANSIGSGKSTTPARAPTRHAPITRSIPRHDRTAYMARGCIAEVDQLFHGVGGVVDATVSEAQAAGF